MALETLVASVQNELENANKAARDAEATQDSEAVRLREALEKARGESDALMQEREASGAEFQALEAAIAVATANKEEERRRAAQSAVEAEEERLEWENVGRTRDAEIAALKVR